MCLLRELSENFNKFYSIQGDNLILSNYKINNGHYILVDSIGNIKEVLKIDKDTDQSQESVRKFAKLDYYSSLLTTNKAVDKKKKILSNNLYSVSIKKDKLKDVNYENIDIYYDGIANLEVSNNNKAKYTELYETVRTELGPVNEQEIEKNRLWIKSNLLDLIEKYSLNDEKQYLKIFFEADIQDYIREGNRYFYTRLFNNNAYNIKINDTVYGLSSFNIAMGADKPAFKNKSRKVEVPHLLPLSEVMGQKKLFDYLYCMVLNGKNNVYINENGIYSNRYAPSNPFKGYYVRVEMDMTNAEIRDFDVINKSSDKEYIIYDYTGAKTESSKEKVMKYNVPLSFDILIEYIDRYFFEKKLLYNIYQHDENVDLRKLSSPVIKRQFYNMRIALRNWFFKGNDTLIKEIAEDGFLDIICDSIAMGRYVIDQYNLMECIINSFGGIKMSDVIKPIYDDLRLKVIERDISVIESDDEFCFAAGQLAYYLLNSNKEARKKQSLINPLLHAKDGNVLKDRLLRIYEKYNFDVNYYSFKAKKTISMIMGYEPEESIKSHIVVAGFTYDNILFEKKEETNEIEEMEEV